MSASFNLLIRDSAHTVGSNGEVGEHTSSLPRSSNQIHVRTLKARDLCIFKIRYTRM